MRVGSSSSFRALRLGSCLALALVSAGCAPVTQAPPVDPELAKIEADKQLLIVVERQIDDLRRLHNASFRILAANFELCEEKGKVTKKFGMQITNSRAFAKDYRAVAEKVLGPAGTFYVSAVPPNSPASAAGIQEGDVLLSVDEAPLPSGENAHKELMSQIADFANKGKTVVFRVRRKGEEHDAHVTPAKICDYAYGIVQKNDVNAFADGQNIVFHTGMMRFAATDEELATVIGHELAHNLMGHIDSKLGNAYIGLIFDVIAAGFGINTQGAFSNMASQAYSQEFETEADYVGLYLMARAGYNIADTPNFWRRMGAEHPGSIRTNHGSSHPPTPYRFVSLDKTVEEINRKKAAGLPLKPEMRKADPMPAAAPSAN